MIHVMVVVEGQTEATFVSDTLAPALWSFDVSLSATILGIPGQKGGRPNYSRVKKDLVRHLKNSHLSFCSTMLDYYGLGKSFPGDPMPVTWPALTRVQALERAIRADLFSTHPELRPELRLIPYIQLHEFEALLFSDAEVFAAAIGKPDLSRTFRDIRGQFATPEEINDSPDTAPSKRIQRHFPSYRKPLSGPIAAAAVGLDAMRDQCPHFREWFEQLRSLSRRE